MNVLNRISNETMITEIKTCKVTKKLQEEQCVDQCTYRNTK